MRELKRIVIGSNFNDDLKAIMQNEKVDFFTKVDHPIVNGWEIVKNDYQFINYRNMALVPIVNDIVRGNVNGRMSAELLWEVFNKDNNISKKKEQIEWWLKTITLGQVNRMPSGLCAWSPDNRLLIVNETRKNWQASSNNMYILGNCCEEQGVVYRYLPKAAPDESTVLILALPNPKSVVDAMKAQKEGRQVIQEPETNLERTVSEIVNRNVDESVMPDQVMPNIAEKIAPQVRRGIKRKGAKEIDIKKLEENFQNDDE